MLGSILGVVAEAATFVEQHFDTGFVAFNLGVAAFTAQQVFADCCLESRLQQHVPDMRLVKEQRH